MDCGEGDKRDVRRPMNAFLIFCKRHRSIVREKNPDLDNRSVTRILGDLWANLKDDEKSMYTDLAKQYKDAFMKANPDYKWHNPEKTVAPQKPALPKPTNMKVLKNGMDLFSEGSIMPGKLADPSNMGGLSLLLIAGQQSDNRNVSFDGLNSDKHTENLKAAAKEENPNTENPSAGPPDKGSDLTVTMETNNGQDCYSSNEFTEIKSQQVDESEEKFGSGTEKTQSLLDLAEMCSNQLDDEKRPNVETVVTVTRNLLKEAILDIKQDTETVHSSAKSDGKLTLDKGSNHETDEKENISKQTVKDTNEETDVEEEEESAMITCGKLVVNHIIDKLYSSDIATAARKVSKPTKGPLEAIVPTSIKTDNNDVDKPISDEKLEKQCENSNVVIKNNSNSLEFDEPDGWKELANNTENVKQEDLVDNKTVKQEDLVDNKTVEDVEHCKDGGVIQGSIDSTQSSEISTGKRKYLLSETGSTEGEDVEESQPIRKSRRRNRGQRYQELINEGIIQPSKERMAALQHPASKDEIAEEDFQSIDSYILPETAIRRIRKRTTSESAKDKMYHPEDVKRYKTGDFDLEAHIATLPACPIESMGRKRGFIRSRHCSESSHIRKHPVEESQVIPVFDAEKTVFLPPHVRLPSPQRCSEPVVGSRKRKARKHSITHLIPVLPPIVRANNNSPNVINAFESPESGSDTQIMEEKRPVTGDTTVSDVITVNCKSYDSDVTNVKGTNSDVTNGKRISSDFNVNGVTDHQDEVNPVPVQEGPSSCDEENQVPVQETPNNSDDIDSLPKIEAGCDMEIEDGSKVKEDITLGATYGEEKLKQELDTESVVDHRLLSKTETDNKSVVAKPEKETESVVDCRHMSKPETDSESAVDHRHMSKPDTDTESVVDHRHMSSKTRSDEINCSGMFGAVNKVESVETSVLNNKETSLNANTFVAGKPSERNCKSLQEVDSNIPRGGNDVITQIEAVDTANMKPKLQDSLEKMGSNPDKPETDLNFNSTVSS